MTSNPNNSDVLQNAQLTMLVALVEALVGTHPDPAALQEEWKRLAAIAGTDWSTRAVGMGKPGFGSSELKQAFSEIDNRMTALVRQKRP